MSATSFTLPSKDETLGFARALASQARSGDCIAISGEVGAGKTTFAAAFFGVFLAADEQVTSPTFNLVQFYKGTQDELLCHADLYRLKQADEWYELGIDEMFDTHITLIDWPEIAANILPEHTLYLHLEGQNETSRLVQIHSSAAHWQAWIEQQQKEATA